MIRSLIRSRRAAVLASAGLAAAFASAANAQTVFDFTDFDPSTNVGNPLEDMGMLNMVGQASNVAALQANGNQALTLPGTGRGAGAMWYNQRIDVREDFISTFSFVANDVHGAGADGLAFVIQDQSANALGGTGGSIGYADNPFFGGNVGLTNSLAVEFDTWDNSPANWADGPGDHVAVHSRGEISNSADEAAGLIPGTRHNLDFDLSNGQIQTARIAYLNGTLSVYLNDLVNPLIELSEFDLANTIGVDDGFAWIGLTSAIAAIDQQRMEIVGWSLVQPNIPAPGAFALLGLGGLVAARRRR